MQRSPSRLNRHTICRIFSIYVLIFSLAYPLHFYDASVWTNDCNYFFACNIWTEHCRVMSRRSSGIWPWGAACELTTLSLKRWDAVKTDKCRHISQFRRKKATSNSEFLILYDHRNFISLASRTNFSGDLCTLNSDFHYMPYTGQRDDDGILSALFAVAIL